MVGWRGIGLAGALASMVVFGGVACGDDDDGATGRKLGPGDTGGAGGNPAGGAGGAGGIANGGAGGVANGGAGGIANGGSGGIANGGAGGIATGGAGGIANGGSGGTSDPGGSGGDPIADPGELVVEKVFCRMGPAADGVDCDEMDLPITIHVLITTYDEEGAEVEVFHGDIEEENEYRALVAPGTYTIGEGCGGLPDGVTCRDPDPKDVTVASGAATVTRLYYDVDESVYEGGTSCDPVVIKVQRNCKNRWNWTCALSTVEVSISGDAVDKVSFDWRRTSRVLNLPCGSFDLEASTSRRLHICPSSTASGVSNGSTVTFQVSDEACN